MAKLSDYATVTNVSGPEFIPLVLVPNGGAAGDGKIAVADLVNSTAFGAFPLASTVTALDARVAFLEGGGVFVTDAALATPLVSNAATYVDIASSGSILANTFAAGDMLACEFQGDILNNSGASRTYKFKWIVAALDIATTPAAGVSLATGTTRRPFHAWMTAIFSDATHFHFAGAFEIASPKAATTEMGPFNGNNTYRDAVASFAGTGVDIASAMTFKMQGQTDASFATADVRRHRQTWSIVKAAA